MEDKQIIGKMAISKDSVLLGKIIRIDKLMGKTIKELKPYAIISIRRFLKRKLSVPIDKAKILKFTADGVVFNITHLEFDKEKESVERILIERESYKEYSSKSWKDHQGGVRVPRRKGD